MFAALRPVLVLSWEKIASCLIYLLLSQIPFWQQKPRSCVLSLEAFLHSSGILFLQNLVSEQLPEVTGSCGFKSSFLFFKICLVFIRISGRVPNRVEDDRFSHVPRRLFVEATFFKQLLSEKWRKARGRRWCFPWGGGEERATPSRVSHLAVTATFIYACNFS